MCTATCCLRRHPIEERPVPCNCHTSPVQWRIRGKIIATFVCAVLCMTLVQKEMKGRIFIQCHFSMPYSQSAETCITQFSLQITPCLPFFHKHLPDGATPNWGSRHFMAAYYSFIDPEGMKGWVALVGWPIADGLTTWVVTHQLQVMQRTGKFADQRPMFYRSAMKPTNQHT